MSHPDHMGNVEVVRRFYELSQRGEPACWELWDEDAVAEPPPDWPDATESIRGVEAIKKGFLSWRAAFGGRFWEGIRPERIIEAPDGRVLVELKWDFSGRHSGVPVKQQVAALYTVKDGHIMRAEHFLDPDAALKACRDPVSALAHIRSYYEALNSGDVDRIAGHFTDDAVHYYTRLGPHEGAPAIAENARWGIEKLDARWHYEHGIEQEDEAVIEWTMTWRDPRSGERRLNRGTEWFRLRDGRISEVRAYHHGDERNRRGDLLGFDFAGRGYTTLEGEASTPRP